MNKRERVIAAFHGQETDHVPVCMWQHVPESFWNDDDRFAAEQARFFRSTDVDFMKLSGDKYFGWPSPVLNGISKAEDLYKIEPLEEVADELCSTFKVNHLNRMGNGMCKLYADTNFMNLLSASEHIVSACSNIAEATVIRVRPELAANEHNYFESLRAGGDESYNEAYRSAKEEYLSKLPPESLDSANLNT